MISSALEFDDGRVEYAQLNYNSCIINKETNESHHEVKLKGGSDSTIIASAVVLAKIIYFCLYQT